MLNEMRGIDEINSNSDLVNQITNIFRKNRLTTQQDLPGLPGLLVHFDLNEVEEDRCEVIQNI